MKLVDKVKGRLPKPITWTVRPEILLHPNIPKPLHGVAPRVILGGKWWDQTRKSAYQATAFHCAACGVWKHEAKVHRWLEGHELYDIDYLHGRSTYVGTVGLCHLCHNFIHSGRLEALLQKGQVTQAKYILVLQHGSSVLAKAGIAFPPPYNGPFAEWGSWRLVLDGKEYPPIYKTFEQWKVAHA